MQITVGTIKVYLSRLYDKLGVADRFELAPTGSAISATTRSRKAPHPLKAPARNADLCRVARPAVAQRVRSCRPFTLHLISRHKRADVRLVPNQSGLVRNESGSAAALPPSPVGSLHTGSHEFPNGPFRLLLGSPDDSRGPPETFRPQSSLGGSVRRGDKPPSIGVAKRKEQGVGWRSCRIVLFHSSSSSSPSLEVFAA